jgi:mono/diheme cytochrome c family protein
MRLALLVFPVALFCVACGEDPVAVTELPPASEAELVALARDPAVLAQGKRLFETGKGYCTTCHGVTGGGTPQGVPLNDATFIHGDSHVDTVRVIRDGVPSKGMQSWKAAFTRDELHALASYVRSLAP